MRDMGATRIVVDGIQVEFHGPAQPLPAIGDAEVPEDEIDGTPMVSMSAEKADWALKKMRPKEFDLNDWYQQKTPPQVVLDEE